MDRKLQERAGSARQQRTNRNRCDVGCPTPPCPGHIWSSAAVHISAPDTTVQPSAQATGGAVLGIVLSISHTYPVPHSHPP